MVLKVSANWIAVTSSPSLIDTGTITLEPGAALTSGTLRVICASASSDVKTSSAMKEH